MKGYIKFQAVEDGLEIKSRLHEVGLIDKAHIVSGMFDVLDIDVNDDKEVSMIVAIASIINNKAKKIKVDLGAIRRAAGVTESHDDEDDGEDDECMNE